MALISLQDQGAFLSEFETKALQVATQTAQPAKPEVVEVVKVSRFGFCSVLIRICNHSSNALS